MSFGDLTDEEFNAFTLEDIFGKGEMEARKEPKAGVVKPLPRAATHRRKSERINLFADDPDTSSQLPNRSSQFKQLPLYALHCPSPTCETKTEMWLTLQRFKTGTGYHIRVSCKTCGKFIKFASPKQYMWAQTLLEQEKHSSGKG